MPLPSRSYLRLCFALALCAGVGVAPHRAAAGLIVGDDFETYVPGNLYGQNGGISGGTGTWTSVYGNYDGPGGHRYNVVSGGLIYSNGAIQIDGGAQHAELSIATTSGGTGFEGSLMREFASQSDTLYFSFLFRTTDLIGDDFMQFLMNDDGDQSNSASIIMSTTYQSRLTADGSSQKTVNSPVSPVVGNTMLLVGKVSKTSGATTYNRLDFFVNPSVLTEGTPTTTLTNNTLASSFDTFSIRTARLDAGDLFQFDALRIGTSYSDVVAPLQTTAVPEPSSMLLCGVAALGGAWRYRRRRGKAAVSVDSHDDALAS